MQEPTLPGAPSVSPSWPPTHRRPGEPLPTAGSAPATSKRGRQSARLSSTGGGSVAPGVAPRGPCGCGGEACGSRPEAELGGGRLARSPGPDPRVPSGQSRPLGNGWTLPLPAAGPAPAPGCYFTPGKSICYPAWPSRKSGLSGQSLCPSQTVPMSHGQGPGRPPRTHKRPRPGTVSPTQTKWRGRAWHWAADPQPEHRERQVAQQGRGPVEWPQAGQLSGPRQQGCRVGLAPAPPHSGRSQKHAAGTAGPGPARAVPLHCT